MQPQSTSDQSPDIDALLNRAAVSLARSQRLVESWLPQSQRPSESTADSNAAEREKRELQAIGRPEKLGLGGERLLELQGGGGQGDELEKLRRRLTGSKGKAREVKTSDRKGKGKEKGKVSAEGSESEDEAGSRAAMFNSKKGKERSGREAEERSKNVKDEAEGHDFEKSSESLQAGSTAARRASDDRPEVSTGKRPASYLDEVLATRAKKKKKKKKKQEASEAAVGKV